MKWILKLRSLVRIYLFQWLKKPLPPAKNPANKFNELPDSMVDSLSSVDPLPPPLAEIPNPRLPLPDPPPPGCKNPSFGSFRPLVFDSVSPPPSSWPEVSNPTLPLAPSPPFSVCGCKNPSLGNFRPTVTRGRVIENWFHWNLRPNIYMAEHRLDE